MVTHSVENALMVRVHEAGCFDANIPRNAGPEWANLRLLLAADAPEAHGLGKRDNMHRSNNENKPRRVASFGCPNPHT